MFGPAGNSKVQKVPTSHIRLVPRRIFQGLIFEKRDILGCNEHLKSDNVTHFVKSRQSCLFTLDVLREAFQTKNV